MLLIQVISCWSPLTSIRHLVVVASVFSLNQILAYMSKGGFWKGRGESKPSILASVWPQRRQSASRYFANVPSLLKNPYVYLVLAAIGIIWWKGWVTGALSPIWYHAVDLLDWTFSSPITLSFTLLSLLLLTAVISQNSSTTLSRSIQPYVPSFLQRNANWLVPTLMMIWKAYESQRSQSPGWIPTIHRWIWGPSLSETWLAIALSAIPVLLPPLLMVTAPKRKAIWWKPSTWGRRRDSPPSSSGPSVPRGTSLAISS
ncbi:hypothetical protein BJ684DRAFT_20268 [Piptocephalis cylindrospora]|uniref:Uncharacterized protein n=1 Tax=Piptocephalis cylindrospora TaxID=1907219 RepID=A0A4P9Y2Y0_9FUNG|nr:hypothetical protein BJ684DRAFT_20268 [Piptocephalis cylindrospora]|eukprot:RKP13227.1 hypothetical protein BJ684DRAFT_20268 [Piptocephalis cylindrospora]